MDYPNHEFSKYIDNEFSFSGSVNNQITNQQSNNSLIDALQSSPCDNNVMLEPRLVEYMKKRKYYKENNIKPTIKLEDEFRITPHDVKNIKKFLSGRKDIYSKKNNEINRMQKSKPQFPSSSFKEDKRVIKLNDDMPKNVKNRGMFVSDSGRYYEDPIQDVDDILDGRDFMSSVDVSPGNFSMNDTRFDPRIDERIPRGRPDPRIGASAYKVPGQLDSRRYDGGSSTHMNDFVSREMISGRKGPNGMSRSSGPIHAGFFDNNSRQEIRQPYSEMSEMDTESRYVMPRIAQRSNNLNTSYMAVPYMGHGTGSCDVDLESEFLQGMPTRTMKSYGYRSQEEHNYDYIDPSFQSQNNTVMDFPRGGEGTRSSNRIPAKPYNRDIY